ncbi:hypothetical protein LOZ58_005461 [Ophidiomyces ophidiicola]|nr:hypothetical protein LOZ58_005461 [Ophidiomyces ophidiicola]
MDMINQHREELIDQALERLHGLHWGFQSGQNSCFFECSSILHGALTKEMAVQGLIPQPMSPFLGLSSREVTHSVQNIRSPRWCSLDQHRCCRHYCNLRDLVYLIVKSLKDKKVGLKLGEFYQGLESQCLSYFWFSKLDMWEFGINWYISEVLYRLSIKDDHPSNAISLAAEPCASHPTT